MTTEPLVSGGPMLLPFRPIRDADLGYAATVLVAFVERYNRNPEGPETLNDWWALPIPLHQRMGVLCGAAAAYPACEHKVRRALQDVAVLVAEAVLPAWSVACPGNSMLHIAVDAARAYLEVPTRDGRAKVRRLARNVKHAVSRINGGVTPHLSVVESNLLTVYNALCAITPADDDDEFSWTQREVMMLLHCAKDAKVDLTTATARLDALVAELSPAPQPHAPAGEEAPHHDE